MKIKALRPFVSGRFSASSGDVLEVPDKTGQRLVNIGIAESQTGSEKKEAPAADNSQVAPKKKVSAGKSGARTRAK